MMHVGKHPNIISLLGACTQNGACDSTSRGKGPRGGGGPKLFYPQNLFSKHPSRLDAGQDKGSPILVLPSWFSWRRLTRCLGTWIEDWVVHENGLTHTQVCAQTSVILTHQSKISGNEQLHNFIQNQRKTSKNNIQTTQKTISFLETKLFGVEATHRLRFCLRFEIETASTRIFR